MGNPEPQKFTRYEDQGAYHWTSLDGPRWKNVRRLRPRFEARYDIVLRTLEERSALGGQGLDVGCGDGVMLYRIHQRGGQCAGIDGDATGVALAEKEAQKRGLSPRVVQGNVYELPFETDEFDYAVSLDVIEHLEQPESALSEMARCVRPGGLVLLTTPMEKAPGTVQDRFHVREYTIESLTELLRPHFRNVEVRGYAPRRLLDMFDARAKWLPRAGWWGVKLGAAVGYNPLDRIQGQRTDAFGDLLAIAEV